MHCKHINIRQAIFILLSVLLNKVENNLGADNLMNFSDGEKDSRKNYSLKNDDIYAPHMQNVGVVLSCPANIECKDLDAACIDCNLNIPCKYGETINTKCKAKEEITCQGPKEFQRNYECRYCYQSEPWEHQCELKANCNSIASPRAYYATNCTINKDIICLGNRIFNKKVKCNWTGGYRWSTALALSIALGGFGADRFYLGHWQEGIGKLFSFGGLGVWTLIDVILISLHYLGPADGSLYIS